MTVEKPVDTVNICKRRRPLWSLKWTHQRRHNFLRLQDVYVTGRTLQKAKDAVADVGTTATGQAKRSTKDVQNVQRQVTQVPRKHWNQFVWQFDEQIDEQIAIFCPLCWVQQVLPLELNLASLTSVRNFVAEWKSSIRRVLKLEVTKLWTKSSQETCGYLGVQCRSSFRHPNLGWDAADATLTHDIGDFFLFQVKTKQKRNSPKTVRET